MVRRRVTDTNEIEVVFLVKAKNPSEAADLLITGEEPELELSASLTEGVAWQLVNGTSGSLGVVGKTVRRRR